MKNGGITLIKIAIIVPKDTVETARLAAKGFKEEINVVFGSMEAGVELAREMERDGYSAIIARGGTYTLLMESNIRIPVISIPITPMDIFESVSEAEKIDSDVSLIILENMKKACESYSLISGKSLKTYEVRSEQEVESSIKELAEQGKKVVVGAGIITKYTSIYGLESVGIKSGKEAIASTIEEARRIAIAQQAEREKEAERNRNIQSVITELYSDLEESAASVQELTASSQELAASSQESTNIAFGVTQEMKEVFEALTIIQTVAKQSNMLGLNAAIEAARAGEHGRGFSIVAQEISKLSEMSTESARNVDNMLKDFQESILQVQRNIEQSNIITHEQANAIELIAQRLEGIREIGEQLTHL